MSYPLSNKCQCQTSVTLSCSYCLRTDRVSPCSAHESDNSARHALVMIAVQNTLSEHHTGSDKGRNGLVLGWQGSVRIGARRPGYEETRQLRLHSAALQRSKSANRGRSGQVLSETPAHGKQARRHIGRWAYLCLHSRIICLTLHADRLSPSQVPDCSVAHERTSRSRSSTRRCDRPADIASNALTAPRWSRRWKTPQPAIIIVEVHALLSPRTSALHQHELAPVQRMKG